MVWKAWRLSWFALWCHYFELECIFSINKLSLCDMKSLNVILVWPLMSLFWISIIKLSLFVLWKPSKVILIWPLMSLFQLKMYIFCSLTLSDIGSSNVISIGVIFNSFWRYFSFYLLIVECHPEMDNSVAHHMLSWFWDIYINFLRVSGINLRPRPTDMRRSRHYVIFYHTWFWGFTTGI